MKTHRINLEQKLNNHLIKTNNQMVRTAQQEATVTLQLYKRQNQNERARLMEEQIKLRVRYQELLHRHFDFQVLKAKLQAKLRRTNG